MFVERLTTNDIEILITALKLKDMYWIANIESPKYCMGNVWKIRMVNKSSGFRSKISFNDFKIYGNCPFNASKIFKAFMYAKFGDEYKQAFNERLTKKYQEELIK